MNEFNARCNICDVKLKSVYKEKHLYYKCNNCQTIYKGFSILKEHSLNSEDYTKLTNPKYFDANVKSFLKSSLLNIIKKNSNHDSKVLDIGCSNGSFIEALRLNNIVDTYGIDIQKEIIEFSKNKGYNCFYGFFPDNIPKQIEHKYDIITSFENIYYMPNIVAFFEKCISLLNSNGKIILKFNQSSSSFYHKHLYHIRVGDFSSFITYDTVVFIAKKFNLKIIEIIPYDNNYVTNYFGYCSWKTKPKSKPNIMLRIINKLSKKIIPIKYADKILIVLEKSS